MLATFDDTASPRLNAYMDASVYISSHELLLSGRFILYKKIRLVANPIPVPIATSKAA